MYTTEFVHTFSDQAHVGYSLKLSEREIWFVWHWLMAPDWNIFAFLEKCVGFFQCLMVFVRTRHPTLQSIKCLRVIKLSRALKAFDFWNSWSFVNQYFSHSTIVELIGRSAWRIMQHFLYCKYYYVGWLLPTMHTGISEDEIIWKWNLLGGGGWRSLKDALSLPLLLWW